MKLTIHHFETLPSTQTSAKAYVLEGATEGTVIIADSQTDGYGRENRIWHSNAGNLTASIVLMPRTHEGAPALKDYGQLGIIFGSAIREGIIDAFADAKDLKLKWPNDGFIQGKKLFGVLCEVFEDAVIVGIGVNVNHVPENSQDIAISLSDIASIKQEVDVSSIFHSILKVLFKNYRTWLSGDFASLKLKWEENALYLGQRVERTVVSKENPDTQNTIIGCFRGLAEDGAMILIDENGTEHLIYT